MKEDMQVCDLHCATSDNCMCVHHCILAFILFLFLPFLPLPFLFLPSPSLLPPSLRMHMQTRCFICGLQKEKLEDISHSFDQHTMKEHHMAHYM